MIEPLDSGLVFSFAGSVLVSGREQRPLFPELRANDPEQGLSMPELRVSVPDPCPNQPEHSPELPEHPEHAPSQLKILLQLPRHVTIRDENEYRLLYCTSRTTS